MIILALFLLGALESARADCYPGDATYSGIVQQIYTGVTHDNIALSFHGNTPLTRQSLCQVLVNRHNYGRNLVTCQQQTNRQYLQNLYISVPSCVSALTYTRGYNSPAGWNKWDGYHSGIWYGKSQHFIDGALWSSPYTKYDSQHTYAVQPVRFDSNDRKTTCTHVDMTGATCRNGWNQSGQGVSDV